MFIFQTLNVIYFEKKMKKFFYINLILFAFCHTTFAAEKESLEKYRAGNVYEKINVSAFPQLQSILN